MKFKNNKAFTLIELIVVIAVIGILVLLAMPKFMGYTQKARLTEIKSNTKQLENASERYYIETQDWPRLSDIAYTAVQIEDFTQQIKDKTGQIVTLDPDGNYYDVDYSKLINYVQKPKDSISYIIQNPVGEIYYLDGLNEEGKNRIKSTNVVTPIQTIQLDLNNITTTSLYGSITYSKSNGSILITDSKNTALPNWVSISNRYKINEMPDLNLMKNFTITANLTAQGVGYKGGGLGIFTENMTLLGYEIVSTHYGTNEKREYYSIRASSVNTTGSNYVHDSNIYSSTIKYVYSSDTRELKLYVNNVLQQSITLTTTERFDGFGLLADKYTAYSILQTKINSISIEYQQ